MYFKQFYLGCLAHASYLVGSDGKAAVVDPRRDVDEYLSEAESQGLRIEYVIETHLHADFVSGHRELAARTGARIVFGRKAEALIPHLPVKDGDEIRIGKVVLRFLETPGHTPESVTVLVVDTQVSPEPRMALTGDTLFIGDVGRPDLVGSKDATPEIMAGLLYDSLHQKLLRLPDAVEVYPAHGAGSLCGRNMSSQTRSTIGEQRRTNYALGEMSRSAFVKMMTADLPEMPQYFPRDVAINREGAPPLAEQPLPPGLAPEQVQRLMDDDSVVLDVRPAAAFGAGHVPGSFNIGLGGQFASWAGTLLDARARLVIVADEEASVREAQLRLARVGLERVAGYLEGGLAAWDRAGRPVATVPQMPVDELRAQMRDTPGTLQILDVRRAAEHAAGHVSGALNIPLLGLARNVERLRSPRLTAVICASGYRSSAGASLLRRHGFADVCNVVGGTNAWIAAGYPTEAS